MQKYTFAVSRSFGGISAFGRWVGESAATWQFYSSRHCLPGFLPHDYLNSFLVRWPRNFILSLKRLRNMTHWTLKYHVNARRLESWPLLCSTSRVEVSASVCALFSATVFRMPTCIKESFICYLQAWTMETSIALRYYCTDVLCVIEAWANFHQNNMSIVHRTTYAVPVIRQEWWYYRGMKFSLSRGEDSFITAVSER